MSDGAASDYAEEALRRRPHGERQCDFPWILARRGRCTGRMAPLDHRTGAGEELALLVRRWIFREYGLRAGELEFSRREPGRCAESCGRKNGTQPGCGRSRPYE